MKIARIIYENVDYWVSLESFVIFKEYISYNDKHVLILSSGLHKVKNSFIFRRDNKFKGLFETSSTFK